MQSLKRPQNVFGPDVDMPSGKRSRSNSQERTIIEKKVISDRFCWRCHKEGTLLECRVCPRSFHPRCDQQGPSQDSQWTCFECRRIMAAEDVDTRSPAMALLSVEQLRTLLKYALLRLMQQALIVFHNPVSVEEYPKYPEYIVHPMDLSQLDKNVRNRVYGCTEAFLADVKWILHNSIIFNGDGHRLTGSAKSIINAAKQEMKEIEICPDCYLNAHTLKETWFMEPCRRAHVLVWAKMKGYPYWPGKALRIVNGNVDVRFFGAHDRAQVPQQLCFLLSYDMPQPLKSKKKAKFNVALEELEHHIQKLRTKLGGFEYAASRTPLDIERLYLQPISKVSTGRRHSDAEQSSQPKGRTVTIVTSSWTRRKEAEGLVKPTVKEKKEKINTSPSPLESSKPELISRMMSSAPIGRMQGGARSLTIKQVVKTEPKHRNSADRLNPPTGVFEISDQSLNIPQDLDINSASINLNVLPMPDMERHREFQSTLDKIQERILERLEDDIQEETNSPEPEVSQPDLSQLEVSQTVLSQTEASQAVLSQPESESELNVSQESARLFLSTDCSIEQEVISEYPNKSPTNELETHSISQEWLDSKKSCAFNQRLGQTIESCKAKLGIQELTVDSPAGKSSESEEEEEESSEEDSVDSESEITAASEQATPKISEKDCPEKPLSEVEELTEATPQLEIFEESEAMDVEISSTVQIDDNSNHSLKEIIHSRSPVDSATVVENALVENELDKEGEVSAMSGEEDLIIDVEGQENPSEQVQRPDSSESDVMTNGIDKLDDAISSKAEDIDTEPPRDSVRQPASETIENNSIPQLEISSESDIANYAHKLIDFMKELGRDGGNNPQATIRSLELELEKQRWHHQQELVEIKHNTDLVLLEVRASLEIEKERTVSELKRKHYIEKNHSLEELKRKFAEEKRQFELDKTRELEEVKKKQWCASCGNEAIFYCCWNTSYCDYPCQKSHWATHQTSCGQLQGNTLVEVPISKNSITITKSPAPVSTPQLSKSTMLKSLVESSGHNIAQNTVQISSIGSPPISKTNSTQQPVQLQYMPNSSCYQIMAPNVTLNTSSIIRPPTARNIVSIQAVTRPTKVNVRTTSPTIVKTYGKQL